MSVSIGDWVFEHAVYDDEVDVLYLSVDGPREGFGEATPQGDIWRFDTDGEFYGITLIGIKRRMESDEGATVTLPRQERIDTAELEPVLVG
jgi:hypothetical protein